MRIASQVFLFLSFLGIFGSSVSASPFDIILGRAPDIAVTDIHQESSYLYMRVCNLGGSITDSDTTIALAMKKSGGGVISMVEPIVLASNDCHEFRIASLDDLGINVSGTYDISAGAILKNGRPENIQSNNKITRSIGVTYPTNSQSSYNYNSSNGNYCNASNGNCSGSTTYYCIPGTSNCSTTPYSTYNNSTYYCNSSNNYCANNNYNGSTTYYRNNICPAYDNACNNNYYNSTNTQYRDSDNRYCTYSNNYCNDNKKDRPIRECTSANNYCKDNYYYNNNNYYNNNQYNLPDLIVQSIYQNSSDKHIIAQICNRGGDMRNSVSLRTNFTSSNMSSSITNSVQMSAGQCTSTIVYTTPGELDLVYSGNYSISVTADVGNNLSESNETNNTLAQSFFIETNHNQKSDLVIDRISANDNNHAIITHVCNIGDDMLDYNNWIIEISNTTNNSTIRNSGYRLSRGQCMDITTSYANLGVYRSGGYNFRAVIDPDNAITEQSRFNNSFSQYLQIWMGY